MTATALQTLDERFASCDAALLTEAVIRFHTGWKYQPPVGDRRFKMLQSRVQRSLKAMGEIARETPADGIARAFIPCWFFSAEKLRIDASVGFLWLDETALVPLVKEVSSLLDGKSFPEATNRSSSPCGLPSQTDAIPSPMFAEKLEQIQVGDEWTLGFEPWSLPLHSLVWLPGGLSPVAEHGFLASVFWAMTQRGFDERAFKPLAEEKEPVRTPVEENAEPSASEHAEGWSYEACYDALAQRLNEWAVGASLVALALGS